MFESVKSYDEGLRNMYTWLEVDAFKHKNVKTHKVLQFLQDAYRPVRPTEGLWNLWYDPVPNAPLASDIKEPNIVREKKRKGKSLKRRKNLTLQWMSRNLKENHSAATQQQLFCMQAVDNPPSWFAATMTGKNYKR